MSKATTLSGMFTDCNALVNLTKATSSGSYSDMFYCCYALVDLTIVGTINAIGLNVSYSKLLSHDSLMSIINALADKTGVSGTW